MTGYCDKKIFVKTVLDEQLEGPVKYYKIGSSCPARGMVVKNIGTNGRSKLIELSHNQADNFANGYRTGVEASLNMLLWQNQGSEKPIPSRILFNGPATIVFWEDGTKTVCKVSKDDAEVGLYSRDTGAAICFLKKIYGDEWRDIFYENRIAADPCKKLSKEAAKKSSKKGKSKNR